MQKDNPSMTLRVSKEFFFDASHSLPHYDGNCQRPHGHTYKLVVEVERVNEDGTGTIDLIQAGPKQGMVFDFADLKTVVKKTILDRVDHYDLNEIFLRTTAEYMVIEMAKWLISAFQNYEIRITTVSLAEICVPTESKATVRITF